MKKKRTRGTKVEKFIVDTAAADVAKARKIRCIEDSFLNKLLPLSSRPDLHDKTRDEVNAAIVAFYKDIEAAAKRHGIADVLVALAVNVAYEEQPGRAMSSMGLGDTFSHPQLAAYALGRAQDEVRKRINQLALGGGR